MKVPLTSGQVSSLTNLITDALAIIALFTLVKCFNAYGRWKLYRTGKVNMNMHFHDMGFVSAFSNAALVRRRSNATFALLCIQGAVCVIILALKISAPSGIVDSRTFHVDWNHTVRGEAFCRKKGRNLAVTRIGEALQKLQTHFESRGGILSVGRTGKNPDALIVEDDEFSLGPTYVVDEFKLSTGLKISVPVSDEPVSFDTSAFTRQTGFEVKYQKASFNEVDFTDTGDQITVGPLYIMQFFSPRSPNSSQKFEMYSFARCYVRRLKLSQGTSKVVRGKCMVSNLGRDTTKNGNWQSISTQPAILGELEGTYSGLNISELGKRWIMVYDLANALSREPCGDSYVAYRPWSKVSERSIIIVCTLGGIAVGGCVAVICSLFITRGTFDWNGSYQRVINLAANSDSVGLGSCWEISEASKADVVVENWNDNEETIRYDVHVTQDNAFSNPVPRASIKLIR